MRTFAGISELEEVVGTHLGYSDWHQVTQSQVDRFAAATGDRQWIHVDEQRAANGPFGTTIAHGFLTVSLIPPLVWQVYKVDGLTMSINYGSEKVRFPSVVPVGSRLRAGVELRDLTTGTSGTRCRTRITIERAGSDKPACVAETLSLLLP
ncbi:MaoC family dehydratase [Rhodococcus opacus]|uniref:Dehydratase n=1 Tax=Rhodococcus opacus TaxID=37919 RepID=A0A076EYU1_RHOOP|nr:MaoC family dehydratase [Rhodococcus opacus]AII10412.1 dehydratase [Rhodococcus opacus]